MFRKNAYPILINKYFNQLFAPVTLKKNYQIKLIKPKLYTWCLENILDNVHLKQGSQTQTGLRAALDSF